MDSSNIIWIRFGWWRNTNQWGRITRSYTHNTDRYLSTQHERDAETGGLEGYDYRGARLYDCDNGRFMSVDMLRAHNNQLNKTPYAYTWNNPIRFVDKDGNLPGPEAYSNPMGVMAEGFRQYFQSILAPLDKLYASFSVTYNKYIGNKVEVKAGPATITLKMTVTTTNTTKVSTNFSGVLSCQNCDNPSEPLIKVDNTTDITQKTSADVKVEAKIVTVKGSADVSVNLVDGKLTNTNEVTVGKGDVNLFISEKKSEEGTKTDVGLKATITSDDGTKSSSIKLGATIQDDKRK